MNDTSCQNCQNRIKKTFCEFCGEKRFVEKELSLVKLLNDLFSLLTDIDGKLLKTVSLLIRKPGQLSLDYIAGIRKSRLNPIQIFLIANIFYFLFSSFYQFNTYNTPLNIHLNASNFIHKDIANELVNKEIVLTGETLKEYGAKFDAKIDVQSRSLIMLMVPIYAFFTFLFFSRAKNGGVKSLVFSAHFFSFALIFQIALYAALNILIWLSNIVFNKDLSIFLLNDTSTSLAMLFSFFVYIFLSARRLFEGSIWIIIVKSLFLAFATYWAILLYRMILFFTTFFTMS